MICPKCNNNIQDGSTMCPFCGELFTVNNVVNNSVLEVEKEDLTKNVGDINNNNISDYEEVVEENKVVEDTKQEERLRIDIPDAASPVDVIDLDNEQQEVPSANTTNAIGNENTNIEEKIDVNLKKKKFNLKFSIKSKVPMAIVLIICVLVFLLGIMLGGSLFSQTVYTSNTPVDIVNSNKTNSTIVGDYNYQIPDNYWFDKQNGGIYVYSDTFRILIKNVNSEYDTIANAKVSIKNSLSSKGVTVSNIKETKINDSKYFVIESVVSMTNRLYAFTNSKENKLFYIEIITLDNKFNYDILKVAQDIINSAKYIENKSELVSASTVDVSDYIIEVSNEHKKQIDAN